MVSYRLLSAADLIPLYECFLEAFSDYQVDMQMSREQFEQRILRDGVRLQISAGAFNDGKMIGFYMNGAALWQGKQTAYDAGTGVIPEYRGRSVAKELFAFMEPRLKEVGIAQYLLEVLSENDRAVALKVNNIDEKLTGTLAFFEANKFKIALKQYEMLKGL